MIRDQFSLLTTDEIIVDLFAGGGGMSSAIESALGRHVDIAINHDMDAISMHMANHPQTHHYCADVFEVCPREATNGRPVGHLHGSPDCTHFSQAVGGQPRSKAIRSLGWVIPRWAGQVTPRSISMENVKQMRQWGPLVAKRCPKTGRVITLETVKCSATGRMINRVAEPGERVPVQQQFLIPDPRHVGRTWRRFLRVLREQGYQVEHRTMVAADYGAATTRERLYLFARRDGRPIVWPEPTHHEKPTPGQKKWRPAADHIDFTDLGQSIFERKRPLAAATMRRIAKGMKKFVLDSANPFIVEIANWSNRNGVQSTADPLRTITAWPRGGSMAVASPSLVPLTHQGGDRVYDPARPIPTITAANRGEIALASAVIVPNTTGNPPKRADTPAPTITTAGNQLLAAATLVQAAYGDGQPGRAQRWGSGLRDIEQPLNTITASGCGGQALAAATLVQMGYGEREGQQPRALNIEKPLGTIVAGGGKHGMASAIIVGAGGPSYSGKPVSVDQPLGTILKENHRHVTTAYMMQANGGFNETVGRSLNEPATTITTTGSQQQLVSAHLATLRRNCVGSDLDEPMPTATAGGEHHALVSYELSYEDEAGALRVAAFLISYYGTGDSASGLDQPMPTATTRDRLALVTVWIAGEPWVIVDIKLRMLKPPELYGCQSFPQDYIIDRGHDGRQFSKSAQVRMVGNSVPRRPAEALIKANCPDLMAWSRAEMKQRERTAA
ncbi:DNA cytosine methyltransferase [Chromobacterium haemolyticum]|uniref:DNA cytosine methyltransferase n=1 Tax=Chromobacterium haemolyticum TaxID=394935 RepID=UPI001747B693|nr:DNA cytosine methyltransferase [Chromobacterium haemolyticum]QOD84149.1 DNA cytosine methyltransferase [Chromobacterium haemolyticum]